MIALDAPAVADELRDTAREVESRGRRSAVGIRGTSNTAHYTASKHAVVGLARTLANVLGPVRIPDAIRDGDDRKAYRVWRATANHFTLGRIDGQWQITARTSRVLDGNPDAHALLTRGLAGAQLAR